MTRAIVGLGLGISWGTWAITVDLGIHGTKGLSV